MNETNRLYGVFDRRLAGREFLAGGYSIADRAACPWIMLHVGHGASPCQGSALREATCRRKEAAV
jgi:glutathione S-transferase